MPVFIFFPYGEAIKACSLIVFRTSKNFIRLVNVCPWYIIGSPSGPSQQSNSIQRHPQRKHLTYASIELSLDT